jgi:hypothetical protein
MSVLSLLVVPMRSRQFTEAPPILSLAIGDRHLCRETLDKRLIQKKLLVVLYPIGSPATVRTLWP